MKANKNPTDAHCSLPPFIEQQWDSPFSKKAKTRMIQQHDVDTVQLQTEWMHANINKWSQIIDPISIS